MRRGEKKITEKSDREVEEKRSTKSFFVALQKKKKKNEVKSSYQCLKCSKGILHSYSRHSNISWE